MRLLKLALISIVVLFVVVYLLSLLIPSQVRISRAINITASKDSILHQLADLREWRNWNTLVNNNNQTSKRYAERSFRSEQVLVQLQTLSPDTITTTWTQEGGKEIASGFTCQSAAGTSVVQWYFDIRLRWYPWEKLGSIAFDKQLGPPMEQSLGNLKKVLEKTPGQY